MGYGVHNCKYFFQVALVIQIWFHGIYLSSSYTINFNTESLLNIFQSWKITIVIYEVIVTLYTLISTYLCSVEKKFRINAFTHILPVELTNIVLQILQIRFVRNFMICNSNIFPEIFRVLNVVMILIIRASS